MSERTPGTWHAEPVVGADGTPELDCWRVYAEGEGGWHVPVACELSEADAKLIARAPELEEADAARDARKLCRRCNGNTVLKIPGGMETCPDCDGTGWAS